MTNIELAITIAVVLLAVILSWWCGYRRGRKRTEERILIDAAQQKRVRLDRTWWTLKFVGHGLTGGAPYCVPMPPPPQRADDKAVT